MIEMPDRMLHPAARFKKARKIVVAVAMVGVTAQRVLVRCNRLISAILIFEQHAQVEEESGAWLARCNRIAV